LLTDIHDPSMIKIDVDGYEGMVFLSGTQALAAKRPTLYIGWTPSLHAAADCDTREVIDLLLTCGYRDAMFFEPSGAAARSVGLLDLHVPPGQYVDMLLIPRNR
jgi:hypothetical protein